MEREKSKREIQVNRIEYLDSLRGFAILLVIVGHLIQYNYTTGLENDIFKIIYSFHMPLFFFLSGCTRCLYESKKGMIGSMTKMGDEFKTKFLSLIVPSIMWTFFVPLFFQNQIFFTGGFSSYWFLNTLFGIFIIWGVYSLLYSYCKESKYVSLLFLCVVIGLFITGVKRIPLMYLMMFMIGYHFQKCNWIDRIPIHVYSLLAVFFCLSVGYFSFTENGVESGNRVWLEFPLSIMASFALIKLFASTSINFFSERLTYLGHYTLGIYLCQFLLVHNLPLKYLETSVNPALQFVILMALSIIIAYICIWLQKIVEKFPLLNGLMYGKLNKVIKK